MPFDLVLVGFGNVARRFVRLLAEREARLSGIGLSWRIVGICTRRHGAAFDAAGLEVDRALAAVESGCSLTSLPARPGLETFASCDGCESIERAAAAHRGAASSGRLVVCETTVLDIERGEPAISHVEAALRAGAHLVTANKGPAAFAYRRLASLAESAGRAFLFEGAVMDGIPVFNLARRTLPAVEVLGFRGVVNSTTNYMLTALEGGGEMGQALREMQAAGIAEADASLDVDGWDAAAKAAALANVLMDGSLTPHDVERTGIGQITGEQVRRARAEGRRIKLVASAWRDRGRPAARVEPVALPADDLLARLDGMQNAIVFETDLLGKLAVIQIDSGLTQTAYALLTDLVAVHERTVSADPESGERRKPHR